MRISDWSSDVCSSDLAETQLAALLDQRSGGARAQVLVLAHQVAVLPEELQAGTDVGRVGGGGTDRAMLTLHQRNGDGQAAVVGRVQRGFRIDRGEQAGVRSEERRVGKEGVRTCRTR